MKITMFLVVTFVSQLGVAQSRPASSFPPAYFHNVPFDFTLEYPGILQPQQIPASRKQVGASTCGNVLFHSVRTDHEQVKQYISDMHGHTLVKTGEATEGSIDIIQTSPSCLPPAAQGHPESAASPLSVQAVSLKGSQLMSPPADYLIGNVRIYEAATISPRDEQQAVHFALATSFLSKGSLITVVFKTNNLAFLNGMIHQKVQIGSGHPTQILPGSIGRAAR